jgi:cellulose synthase/poly-beta-1,6-N-acetylglucosamine synthase-like glycosyltransferase
LLICFIKKNKSGFMFEIVIFCSIIIYSIRSIIFIFGSYKERNKYNTKSLSEEFPFVSIIIPARNEEGNIANCIKSVAQNTYPIDKYEIIAINDRSTDNTQQILFNLQNQYQNLKVVNITEETKNHNLLGKPGALQAGIDISSGEFILMTDADCVVNSNWIRTIVNNFIHGIGIIPSFTLIKAKTFFDKVQEVEWVFMHTMASAGIGLKQPLGCYGNNLSVRKSDFNQMGGFQNVKFSVTEDLALLQTIIKNGSQAHYLTHPDAAVTTLPCRTIKEYISQHHRWALGGIALGWRAAIFVISSIALWSGIIISIITGNCLTLIAVVSTRLIGDFLVIAPPLKILKQTKLYLWIIPSILCLMLIEIFIPFLILDKKVTWKNQVFKHNK